MSKHALLSLVIISQVSLAASKPNNRLWSALKTKIEQANPNVVNIVSNTGALLLSIPVIIGITLVVTKPVRELEHEYRQREIFTRALVRGEREVVNSQLELDDFELERYIGLTIHYVQNGQHSLGTVVSVDRAHNALTLADNNDLVRHAEVEGVLLLDSFVQGRIVAFHIRDAHLLDPSKEYLFIGRVSAFGAVAGVTSGGYLLVRPYVTHDDPDIRREAFTSLLYLVHEQDLPTTR